MDEWLRRKTARTDMAGHRRGQRDARLRFVLENRSLLELRPTLRIERDAFENPFLVFVVIESPMIGVRGETVAINFECMR